MKRLPIHGADGSHIGNIMLLDRIDEALRKDVIMVLSPVIKDYETVGYMLSPQSAIQRRLMVQEDKVNDEQQTHTTNLG